MKFFRWFKPAPHTARLSPTGIISHNIGGGIAGIVAAKSAEHWGWQSAFYVPGAITAIGVVRPRG